MTTTSSRFFDELAKLMGNAAGAAQGMRREIDTLVQGQVERVLNHLDVVKRDDFEAVKAMAAKAREENDQLARRLDDLEAKVAAGSKPDHSL
jgi:BMFP domain-containing protein YqiC